MNPSGTDDSDYDRWRRHYRARIERFRAIHRGQTGFLLGNGPSLNQVDLGRLHGASVIGTNKIFLKIDRSGLRLAYYVAVSREKIGANASGIADLDAVCFLSHQHWDRSLLPEADNRIPVFTVGDIGTPGSGSVFQDDLTRPVPIENTVTFVALQIAYFLGYAKIVMLGFDHRFDAAHEPNVMVRASTGCSDHFDPDYHRGEAHHTPDSASYEAAFDKAGERFEAAGRCIVNASPDSALSAFPRIALSDAFALAG